MAQYIEETRTITASVTEPQDGQAYEWVFDVDNPVRFILSIEIDSVTSSGYLDGQNDEEIFGVLIDAENTGDSVVYEKSAWLDTTQVDSYDITDISEKRYYELADYSTRSYYPHTEYLGIYLEWWDNVAEGEVPRTHTVEVTYTVKGYDEKPTTIELSGQVLDTAGNPMRNAVVGYDWERTGYSQSTKGVPYNADDYRLSNSVGVVDGSGNYNLVIPIDSFVDAGNDFEKYDINNFTRDINIFVANAGDSGNSGIEYYTGQSFDTTITKNFTVNQVNTEIYDPEDLYNIRYYSAGDYKLMNDIDLEGSQYNDPFIPIRFAGSRNFEGKLNGNGYSIKNLKITGTETSSWSEVGFMHYINGTGNYPAAVYNLNFDNPEVHGGSTTGVLTPAILDNAYVSNITINDGKLFAQTDSIGMIGGLAGYCDVKLEDENVFSINSWSSFPIVDNPDYIKGLLIDVDILIGRSSYSIGGLFGEIYTSSDTSNTYPVANFESCYYKGNIDYDPNAGGTYLDSVGGFFGYDWIKENHAVELKNCYVKSNLFMNPVPDSSDNIGAFVGTYRYDENSRTLKNVYFAGDMCSYYNFATEFFIGSDYPVIYENNYYNSELASSAITGGEARTTDEMTYPFSSNTYNDWDFSYMPDPADYDYPDTVDFQNDSIEEIINKTNEGYPELGPEGIIWFPLAPFVAEGVGIVKFGGNFFWVKKNDTWHPASGFVKKGGSWHPITLADVKKGGTWA